jgi:hypothetical protein
MADALGPRLGHQGGQDLTTVPRQERQLLLLEPLRAQHPKLAPHLLTLTGPNRKSWRRQSGKKPPDFEDGTNIPEIGEALITSKVVTLDPAWKPDEPSP